MLAVADKMEPLAGLNVTVAWPAATPAGTRKLTWVGET